MTAGLTAALCSGFEPGSGAASAARIAAPLAIGTGILVWLLALTRAGLAVLFIAGTLICCGASFLEFPVPDWVFPVFGAACVAAYLYRNYTLTRRRPGCRPADAPRFFLQSGAVALAAMLAAAGLWAGLVRPANPPVRDLDLVRALQQVQLIEDLGIYNPDDRAGHRSTDAGEDPAEEQTDADSDSTGADQQAEESETDSTGQGQTDVGSTGVGTGGSASGSPEGFDLRLLWLLLLIPVAVAAAYGIKARSRRRWKAAVESCDPETAARNYYLFLLDKFDKMGIYKDDDVTLRQFAADSADRTAAFATDAADFEQLTQIYERLAYGGGSLRPGEIEGFRSMYTAFYPALQRKLGKPQYWLQYFRY